MRIVEFEPDDDNLEHLSRHGISLADLDAFLAKRITFRINKQIKFAPTDQTATAGTA